MKIIRTETQTVEVPIFGLSRSPATPEDLQGNIADALNTVLGDQLYDEVATSSRLILTIERVYREDPTP